MSKVSSDNVMEIHSYAMIENERLTELRCTTGIHFKTYILRLYSIGNKQYRVQAYWGKIGKTVQTGSKFIGPLEGAEKVFQKVLNDKLRPHGSDGNFYELYKDLKKMTEVSAMEVEQMSQLVEIAEGAKGIFIEKEGNTFIQYLEV